MEKRNELLEQIKVSEVTRQFMGVTALRDVSFETYQGDFTLVTGPSGSGKTTLLNIMSGIDRPSKGSVEFNGTDITDLSKSKLAQYRATTGQIFQRSGLLAGLTAAQNIVFPHNLTGNKVDGRWTSKLCETLGIVDLLDKPAGELSGGESQRVAITRALAHKPDLVFADEPTASLDTKSKVGIHEIMRNLVDESAVSIVMVSHDELSQDYADRTVVLRDGMIQSDQAKSSS